MHSTIINGRSLLEAAPIKSMLTSKVIHEASGASYGLTEIGYDVRIAEEVVFEPGCLILLPDTQARIRSAPSVTVNGMPHYGARFALASVMEELDMPADLAAQVKDKSTWARRGLSVFNTMVNPGQQGFLTLELVFNGEEKIVIQPGTPIAQMVFQYVTHTAPYQGRYQNQEAGPQVAR